MGDLHPDMEISHFILLLYTSQTWLSSFISLQATAFPIISSLPATMSISAPASPARLGVQQLRALTPAQLQRLKQVRRRILFAQPNAECSFQRAKSKKRNSENIIQDLLRLHPDGVPRCVFLHLLNVPYISAEFGSRTTTMPRHRRLTSSPKKNRTMHGNAAHPPIATNLCRALTRQS